MAIRLATSIAAAAMLLLVTARLEAEVAVTLDTDFAQAVLADVCSNTPVDVDAIRSSKAAQQMVAHFAQFRDYFTMDAYLEARQRAANCEKAERDIYRFNALVEDRDGFARQLKALAELGAGLSDDIGSMLSPYVPQGLAYDGKAVVMVGTPSCGGWSNGPIFYVDLPCLNGDREGLKYLVAHESYHGMQDLFMQDTADQPPLVRMLSQMMREGSATAIADFDQISEPGSYSKFSQDVIRENERRSAENFQLLEMASAYLLAAETEERYGVVNNIGLSGSFGAPLYYVGASMVRALEAARGRQALVCLLASPPAAFVASYHALSQENPDLAPIGATLESWISRQTARADACHP